MSRDVSTIRGVIEFALEQEAESQGLYQILGRQSESPRAKAIFDQLSAEESKHHAALASLNAAVLGTVSIKHVTDLKISDYLHDVSYSPDMTYQDIMVFAMKSEEHSHHLYQGLADHTEDAELKEIFQFLAMQEAQHKLRLETEYDDHVLKEN